MSAFNYLIIAVAKVFDLVVDIYTMVIIVSALLSWVSPDPYNPIVRLLRGLTEPVYTQVRRFLPASLRHARIDVSPMIVLLFLVFVETIVVQVLFDLARK